MRRYETVIIVDPDVTEDNRTGLFDRVREIISKQDGVLVVLHEWGVQRMAYEIKKKIRGFYVRLDYCGMGPLVQELERFFRIDDRVLKYMTIILKKQVDMAAIEQEIAALTAKTETPETPETPLTGDGDSEPAVQTQDDGENPAESADDAGQDSADADNKNENASTESDSDGAIEGDDDDKKER